MACADETTPHQLVEDESAVEDAVATIRKECVIAVDCEGVKLSRNGSLTVLALATRSKTYLFDIMKLGPRIFEAGIQGVLESADIVKLFFDCRGDVDALWHLFDVKVANVMDVQLMQVLYEKRHPDEKSSDQIEREALSEKYADSSPEKRALFDWPKVRSLAKCIEWYLHKPSLLALKNKVSLYAVGADQEKWGRRPLTEDMLLYASIDVQTLFDLYDKFSKKLSSDDVKTARKGSEKYLHVRDQRSVVNIPYDNLLPMYVLTDRPNGDSKECPICKREILVADFNQREMCIPCHLRKFGREEFEKRQAAREKKMLSNQGRDRRQQRRRPNKKR